jgi:hypothetical protein
MQIQRIVMYVFLERYDVWVNHKKWSSVTKYDCSDNRKNLKFKYQRALCLSISRSKVRNIHNVHEIWCKRSTERAYQSACISKFKLFPLHLVREYAPHFARHWPISFCPHRSTILILHMKLKPNRIKSLEQQVRKSRKRNNSGTSLCCCFEVLIWGQVGLLLIMFYKGCTMGKADEQQHSQFCCS